MNIYRARPGSFQARLYAYLKTQPPGTELSSPEVSEVIGAPRHSVASLFIHSVQGGMFLRREAQRGSNGKLMWSLNPEYEAKIAAAPKHDPAAIKPKAQATFNARPKPMKAPQGPVVIPEGLEVTICPSPMFFNAVQVDPASRPYGAGFSAEWERLRMTR